MSKDNRNEGLVFSKMLPKWRSGVWGRGRHRDSGGRKQILWWKVGYWNDLCRKIILITDIF